MKRACLDWMLAAVAALIIAAAIVRAAAVLRFDPGAQLDPRGDLDMRQLLGLPGNHRISRLVASDRPPHGMAALWVDHRDGISAIVPDGAGRLRIGRDLGVAAGRRADQLTDEVLAGLDSSGWPLLPPELARLSVRVWDPAAAVYVTAGPDGKPGTAGADDDGDGAIDDVGELGASDSDDVVVAPRQDGYAAAASGEIIAAVISRGAMVDVQTAAVITAPQAADPRSPASEVWFEFAAAGEPSTAAAPGVQLVLQVQ